MSIMLRCAIISRTRIFSSHSRSSFVINVSPANLHSRSSLYNHKVYDFDDVKSHVERLTPERILIDVREPTEYIAGYIPGAINIPISSQPDALSLPPDEFEERFGFQKPSKDAQLVFYCKAGIRSSAAAHLAVQEGYENVGEYRGSWVDWIKNQGNA